MRDVEKPFVAAAASFMPSSEETMQVQLVTVEFNCFIQCAPASINVYMKAITKKRRT